jgi:hypothetical protein
VIEIGLLILEKTIFKDFANINLYVKPVFPIVPLSNPKDNDLYKLESAPIKEDLC